MPVDLDLTPLAIALPVVWGLFVILLKEMRK